MFNVKFASLAINGSSKKKEYGSDVVRQCTIRGVAMLGEKLDMKLLGLIHFQDSKPAVVVVEYGLEVDDGTTNITEGSQQQQFTTKLVDATLSISDVYQQLLQPNSGSQQPGSWPSDSVDGFALKQTFLRYNNTDKAIKVGKSHLRSWPFCQWVL
jgi:hypothetical protein